MGRADVYFQSTIRVLRNDPAKDPLTTRKLVDRIKGYGICHVAAKLKKQTGDRRLLTLARECMAAQGVPDTSGDMDPDRLALTVAAARLGMTFNDDPKVYLDFYSRMGAGAAQFRIRGSYLATALHDDWPVLKLRTLCGLLAAIGDRDAARVATIAVRALGAGYPSAKQTPPESLLSDGGTDHWIEQLWFRNFIQLCTHRRGRWYSVRCPNDRYLAKVVKRLTAKSDGKLPLDTDDSDSDPDRPVRQTRPR